MQLTATKTGRGFGLIKFTDKYGEACTLQKSSLASEPAIWLGITDPEVKILASSCDPKLSGLINYPIPDNTFLSGRMHLTQDMVAALIPILQQFVDTGEVES